MALASRDLRARILAPRERYSAREPSPKAATPIRAPAAAGPMTRVTWTLMLVMLAQFCLGVFTLLNVVPIGLASLHQAGACIVLVVMVYLVYLVQPVPLSAYRAESG